MSALLARFPELHVVAIDTPIGLPVGRSRPADAAARAFVGPERVATLFADAYAASAHGEPYSSARRRRRTGIFGDRIREVAEIAAADDRIVEVHPEVSFRALKGSPVRYSQRSWSGISERRTLLASAGILLPDELPGGGRTAPDDVVDAAVAAWSAMRVAEGRSATLPAELLVGDGRAGAGAPDGRAPRTGGDGSSAAS